MALSKNRPSVWAAINGAAERFSEKTGIGTGYDYNLYDFIQWRSPDVEAFVEKHLAQICAMEGLTHEQFDRRYATNKRTAVQTYAVDTLKEAWELSSAEVTVHKKRILACGMVATTAIGGALYAAADPQSVLRYDAAGFVEKVGLAAAGVLFITYLTPFTSLWMRLREKLYNAQFNAKGGIISDAPGSRWVTHRANHRIDVVLGLPTGFKKLAASIKNRKKEPARRPSTTVAQEGCQPLKYVPPPAWDRLNP